MVQTSRKFEREFSMAPFASMLAHAIVLALFIFGLPQFNRTPEENPAIEVELAAPEEKPEPQQKPAAEPREAAKDTPAEQAQAKPSPPANLRPVSKFGEKDARASKSVESDAQRETNIAGARTAAEPASKEVPPAQVASAMDALAREPAAVPVPVPAPSPPAVVETARQDSPDSGNEDQVETTAMGDLPRAIRAGQLCVTELRRQLNNSNPPYWPDLLPSYRLEKGNVLQVRKGAFRADARWYNLEFRCEVDEAATSVVSLSFAIGAPVPRAEWTRRGFPAM